MVYLAVVVLNRFPKNTKILPKTQKYLQKHESTFKNREIPSKTRKYYQK